MYQRPRYLLWTFIAVFLQCSLSLRSVSHGGMDLSILESTHQLQEPITEFSTPLDKALLKQEHLNTWRDLRTIEEVVRHRKDPWIFRKKVAEFVQQLSKDPTYLPDGTQIKSQDIVLKPRYKSLESISLLMSQLKQVLKAHSPQIYHQEIDHIYDTLLKNFKESFVVNRQSMKGTLIYTFMDVTMSQSGLYLWMQNFRDKAVDLNTGMHPLVGKMNEWKGQVGNTEHVEWSKMYQKYMKLVEVFDILAAAGLQDKDVILKMVPSDMKLHETNGILFEHSSKPSNLKYYLINNKPHSYPRPLHLPIFGFPFEIDGWNPAEIEDQVHKIWSKLEKSDLEIALELRKPVLDFSQSKIKFPKEVITMKEYQVLMAMTTDSGYKTMWRSISRSINLVSKLEENNPEAQVLLWHILQLEFKYLSPRNVDPKKAEIQIENSVMFYLFVRRMGEVLEEVFRIFTPTPPGKRVHKAQCMMYYWSLLLYKPPTVSYKRYNKAKWMQLGLGRVYLDHLLSSQKLNKLYKTMSTTQDSDREMPYTSSTPNFINNLVQSNIGHSPEEIESLGQSPLDFSMDSINRLNFMAARKREENHSKQIMDHEIKSDKASDSPSPKRKVLMHDDPEQMHLTSVSKKPRTKRVEYVQPSDIDETQIPKNILNMRETKLDGIKSTIHSDLFVDKQNVIQDPRCKTPGNDQAGARNIVQRMEPPSSSSADRQAFILPDLNEPAEPESM
ncbi:uncharacterized protein MELLADRAFT_65157 [Melampsora larici-populina 98AG31]|uniref:Secreted protein n=1 Tax=Melampsora larici-populina (strain 98AG31 / pathotype 3-4-7) TaxID=747676 RepID=F4RU64_MELLP|nr:uncharacterized protein MELLADRAFT_65157 [Melampsora larici-populina 98AG31]EGG04124.1 hypothetical protein MELLADRAFT_65157 [Melampsora larici-populina 98AG31]